MKRDAERDRENGLFFAVRCGERRNLTKGDTVGVLSCFQNRNLQIKIKQKIKKFEQGEIGITKQVTAGSPALTKVNKRISCYDIEGV